MSYTTFGVHTGLHTGMPTARVGTRGTVNLGLDMVGRALFMRPASPLHSGIPSYSTKPHSKHHPNITIQLYRAFKDIEFPVCMRLPGLDPSQVHGAGATLVQARKLTKCASP